MSASQRMPVVFFGHGSPMIALETNDTTRAWAAIAEAIPRPKAILCVSAHWLTKGVGVTAMDKPRTIHDFGAFPQALFDVQYPAPGAPDLAERVRQILAPTRVILDQQAWGLDHGTWSVLVKAYPKADVPVVQLSMDVDLSPQGHFDLGRRLAPLRDEGVLIIASGNIVHNLPKMDWSAQNGPAFDWAARFNDAMRTAIAEDRPDAVVEFASLGRDASLSVPSPDHFWPLLYILGARAPGEAASFPVDHIEYGSLSMTSVVIGADPPVARAA
ncbi:MAG: 4,5-DOPA dioxygenase extradiol [Caulobacteraceae bacterium]|nr:4,5-DOPA dioxygenase extradiol [Caulobacteraceae bacterium]